MNKSFDIHDKNNSSYHLPPLRYNQSVQVQSSKFRAQSQNQLNVTKIPIARKIVSIDNLANVQEYQNMNQKQLLRQHQSLLKILKKYQEIIDINLIRKQKQKSNKNGKPINKEMLMSQQSQNNKKIIQNHLNEIKQLEGTKKLRTLDEILTQKAQISQKIKKVKVELFNLKNTDTMISTKLVNERGNIQRELKQHERDLKVQLTKNGQHKKKIQELTQALKQLKSKDTSNNNIRGYLHKRQSVMKIQQKKIQLEELLNLLKHKDQSIQEVMVNKTKRNKGIQKDIEITQKKIQQVNLQIQNCKEKINKFQKVMELA